MRQLPDPNGTAPAISVIVPVYNAERYLEQCIGAVLGQTFSDIEVIAIDDGSTDSSPAILARFAAADPRLRVITQPNAGYGASVNRGIGEARGEYVGIIESDDWPSPRMYGTLYRAAKRHDADLVKCDFHDTYETGESIRRNLRGHAYNRLFDTADVPEVVLISPTPWAALYRKSFLEGNAVTCRETPGAAFQDTAFSLKALISARRCVFIPDVLVHYRRDNEAASTNSTGKAFAICDEMGEARRYLAERSELEARFLPWLHLDIWRTYAWNRTRIAPELRTGYDERVRGEFAEAIASGEADLALFTAAELDAMHAQLAGTAAAPELARALGLRKLLADPANVKVSVVMPVYEDAATLERAVRSCLVQTHRNVEVVAVDDAASDDGSHGILERLVREDARLQVVTREANTGAHDARLAGVARASGDIVTFLDADDELVRTACAEIVDAFAELPTDIVHVGMRVRPAKGVPDEAVRDMVAWTCPHDGYLPGREIVTRSFVDKGHSFGVCGKAVLADVAKAAFEAVGPCAASFGEDALEYFSIALRARSYRGVPERRLYVYHLGAGHSASGGMTRDGFRRTLSGSRAVAAMQALAGGGGQLAGTYAKACEAHRADQLAITLRSWRDDVVAADRPACLRDILATWPRDEVIDAACTLGTPTFELVVAALGEAVEPTVEQAYALGVADGYAEAAGEYEASGTYRLGRAIGALPRKALALAGR